MLSNKEKFIFTSELALAISNGLQIEEGLKMLAGFDAGGKSLCKKTDGYHAGWDVFCGCTKTVE